MTRIYRIVILTSIILVLELNSKICVAKRQASYDFCHTDVDCKENSYCTKQKCKCMEGYLLKRNSRAYQCLKVLVVGEQCERDSQCQVLLESAICKSGVCTCSDEFYSHNGRCYLRSKLDEICMSDENCYIKDNTGNWTNTNCVNGICKCNSRQVPSTEKDRCLTIKKLGEVCINDNECTLQTPNSVCLGSCKCNFGYVETRDTSNCTKAAEKIGDSCEIDAQCSKLLVQSVCVSGKCGCFPDFHNYSNKCVKTNITGESCREDIDCVNEKNLETSVKCQEKTCHCVDGQNEDGSCNVERVAVHKKVDDNSSAIKITNLIYFYFLFVPMLVKF